jgi:hypothetical protein
MSWGYGRDRETFPDVSRVFPAPGIKDSIDSTIDELSSSHTALLGGGRLTGNTGDDRYRRKALVLPSW